MQCPVKAAHPHAHEDDIPNGRKRTRMHQLLDDFSRCEVTLQAAEAC